MPETVSFDRRAERLEHMFAERGERARNSSSRREWQRVFNLILDDRARLGDLDEATRDVIQREYVHLDEQEREEFADSLMETFRWWEEVDIEEVRADRRLLLPPSLREQEGGVP